MKPLPLALFLLSSLVVLAGLAGCSRPAATRAAGADDIDYYTCTMHPSVHSHDPDGKCPICGMDLVPVQKAEAQARPGGAGADDRPHDFTIPPDRQQLIGVTYATAAVRPLRRVLRVAGTVEAPTAQHRVRAEFHEDELPLLRPGLPVTITRSAQPGLAIAGRIAVVAASLNEATQTGRAWIDVDEAEARLRPGAYVDVNLALDEGQGLTVPVDAVLPTGEHAVVFVDRGAGRLEPRLVQLGGQFGGLYQVTGGLRAGERVVSSANFLVDAEAQVQGALKSW